MRADSIKSGFVYGNETAATYYRRLVSLYRLYNGLRSPGDVFRRVNSWNLKLAFTSHGAWSAEFDRSLMSVPAPRLRKRYRPFSSWTDPVEKNVNARFLFQGCDHLGEEL
jgi:hypothetical protein